MEESVSPNKPGPPAEREEPKNGGDVS